MSFERALNNQFSRKLQDLITLLTSLETKLDANNTALADIKSELMWSNNHTNPSSIAHSHLLTHTKLDDVKTLITATNAELAYISNASTNESLAHSLVAIKDNTAP